jgi:plasmid stabilization system protein ParE
VKVRFHPDASAELDAAAVWYEQEQPGLGVALLAELSLATVAIAEAPQTWPIVSKHRQIRRFLLARFPFAVLFVVVADGVVVLAVAHTKRRPFYWRARRLP